MAFTLYPPPPPPWYYNVIRVEMKTAEYAVNKFLCEEIYTK